MMREAKNRGDGDDRFHFHVLSEANMENLGAHLVSYSPHAQTTSNTRNHGWCHNGSQTVLSGASMVCMNSQGRVLDWRTTQPINICTMPTLFFEIHGWLGPVFIFGVLHPFVVEWDCFVCHKRFDFSVCIHPETQVFTCHAHTAICMPLYTWWQQTLCSCLHLYNNFLHIYNIYLCAVSRLHNV